MTRKHLMTSLSHHCNVQCATKAEIHISLHRYQTGCLSSFLLLLLLSAASSRHSQLRRMCFCRVAVWTSAAVLLWLWCRLAAPPQSLPVWLCTHLQTALLPDSCQADAIHCECRALYAPNRKSLSLGTPHCYSVIHGVSNYLFFGHVT